MRTYIYARASSRLGYPRRNYDGHGTVRYYDCDRIFVTFTLEFLPFFPPTLHNAEQLARRNFVHSETPRLEAV